MIKDCPSLKSSPFRIGELTCLKTLTNFIVGSETGFGLAELHKLQLGGKLYIKGLENVSNEEDLSMSGCMVMGNIFSSLDEKYFYSESPG